MRISFVLILSFLLTIGLLAADEKNEPVSQTDLQKLNPDGSIAIIQYNAKQQQKIERIGKEVDDYHAVINEKIKFLSFEKKIKDSRYGQVTNAREIHLPFEPSYVLHSRFVMKLKGGGGAEGGGFSLDEISFWSRKSLTEKGKDPITTYRELKNNTSGGVKGLTLSVRTVTNADDNTLSFELEKIQSPWERLRLAKAYRDRLREVARTIDRYIQAKGSLETRMVSESIMEVSVSGDFQEP
ncbi:hypothetical protein NUH30_12835 [Leptospira sp. 85282-16]|uniref:Uncharacterized protein n=1 Tax=Leptospira montravelensis TaxID=2484961 RepID=A0ABY2LPD5_9LEPT|nr:MULTISPECIES: hypothetical protein [Leptospira]MCT8334561.1 hypothetical protein [Leptospira sp. 85282-16]TGK80912.1 hypothetical protein EHQ19_14845 [Leptospira montravelensis]TGL01495.1 hypothetical protein EHQ31_11980 [Leptospira montravelensis]